MLVSWGFRSGSLKDSSNLFFIPFFFLYFIVFRFSTPFSLISAIVCLWPFCPQIPNNATLRHATGGQTSLSLIRGQEGIAESEPQTGATPATDLLAESEPVSLGAALGGLGFSSGNAWLS